MSFSYQRAADSLLGLKRAKGLSVHVNYHNVKVALYRFFPLSFLFKTRHATTSAIGPIDSYTEQPESWIQICTKHTIKRHLNYDNNSDHLWVVSLPDRVVVLIT